MTTLYLRERCFRRLRRQKHSPIYNRLNMIAVRFSDLSLKKIILFFHPAYNKKFFLSQQPRGRGGRSASAVNSAAWSRRNLFALYLLRWEHFLRAPDGTHSPGISKPPPPPRQALSGWVYLVRDRFSAKINRCLLLLKFGMWKVELLK